MRSAYLVRMRSRGEEGGVNEPGCLGPAIRARDEEKSRMSVGGWVCTLFRVCVGVFWLWKTTKVSILMWIGRNKRRWSVIENCRCVVKVVRMAKGEEIIGQRQRGIMANGHGARVGDRKDSG